MLENNTKEVNSILSKTLLWAGVALVILLIINAVGIYSFDSGLVTRIIIAGIVTTVCPTVFIKFNAPDHFVKNYILISMAFATCILAMDDRMGIYITYLLAPVISCLYFDKKLTLRIGLISYVAMAIGEYVSSAAKYEVTTNQKTQTEVFFLYIIGFTIEYVVSMIFLLNVVNRAYKYFEIQQNNLLLLQREKERKLEMNRLYQESLSNQRRTAYSMMSREVDNLTSEDVALLSSGQQFVSQLQDIFNLNTNYNEAIRKVLAAVGDFYKLDRIFCMEAHPEEQKCKIAYQWVRDSKDIITNFPESMSNEDYEKIKHLYDEKGYTELTKTQLNAMKKNAFVPVSGIGEALFGLCLGSQLFIPLTEGEEYIGAISFGKYDENGFSIVEKIIFNDIVGIVSSNLSRFKAKTANEAKSAFLSTMSHEIRTPMNAILGMTTVALREEMSDIVKNSLQVIRSSGEGLLALINDILDFSKIESGRIDIVPEDYQIMAVLNDVRTLVNTRNLEKGLKINYEIAKDLPSVLHGDCVRIKQAMVNLGTNAVKYTDEGSVTIRVSMDKDGNQGKLYFEVQDTGQGIKEEDLPKLFKSFSQVNVESNHHKEGTGLGLAITKQLIELMNGHVEVKSEYGKGSTFSFSLPQGIIDSTPAGDIDSFKYEDKDDNVAFKSKGANVLIVDDNNVNLKVAGLLFKPFEFKIDKAVNG